MPSTMTKAQMFLRVMLLLGLWPNQGGSLRNAPIETRLSRHGTAAGARRSAVVRMAVARADKAVVEAGLVPTRSAAKVLIKAGLLMHGGATVKRPSETVDSRALELAEGAEAVFGKFVSRAGYKLEACLETDLGARFVAVDGCSALDVGASTGGFTDCLLQRGAARVVAIDVGHGQLHERIASDARVTSYEGVNARSVTAEELQAAAPANRPANGELFGGTIDAISDGSGRGPSSSSSSLGSSFLFDVVVIDVSFISLSLVLPNVWKFVNPAGGTVVALVKPQFEVGGLDDEAGGLKALHRGRGIVHDDRLRRKALDAIVALAGEEGVLTGAVDDHDCNRDRDRDQQRPTTGLAPPRLAGAKVLGHMECPVKGTDGNAEWLLVLRREGVSGEGGGGDETREKEGLVGVDRRAQHILQR
jgi:23S rRNA (cytidine1920-2'-O)/16S rRNA (cytidine1409-2'-O)-methyltransferase